MNQDARKRLDRLLSSLYPMAMHNDLEIYPRGYDVEADVLYLDVMAASFPMWADVAYEFANHEGMKYDRNYDVYGIDGQPRVSYSGLVWVRFLGDFEDESRVGMHIWSQQPSHIQAEEQLARYYSHFLERDGLEPMEVLMLYL